MLVLTRKPEEEITVDGTCRIRVLAIKGNRVRLGFYGAYETIVRRAEIDEFTPDERAAHEAAADQRLERLSRYEND